MTQSDDPSSTNVPLPSIEKTGSDFVVISPVQPADRQYQCYCCGQPNPAAAFECEKCLVRL